MYSDSNNTNSVEEKKARFEGLFYLQEVKDKYDRLKKVEGVRERDLESEIFKLGSFSFILDAYRKSNREAYQKFYRLIEYCHDRGVEATEPDEIHAFEQAKSLIALRAVKEPKIRQQLQDMVNDVALKVCSELATSILLLSEKIEQGQEPEQRKKLKLR